MSDAPTEPGGFVGDIYYGDPDRTTFGTHRWNGSEWMALASEAEALTMLLGSARARIVDLERQLADARDKALEEAAKLIDKRADDYHTEHGFYDYSTDVTEYPGNGSESMEEWEELAAAIRNLKDTP